MSKTLASVFQQAFRYAAENKIEMIIKVDDGLFQTFDGTTGQRMCYLQRHGYGSQSDPEKCPNKFKVIRCLTFTNESDKGKSGAILGIIDLEDLSDRSKFSMVNNRILTVGDVEFQFAESVFP